MVKTHLKEKRFQFTPAALVLGMMILAFGVICYPVQGAPTEDVHPKECGQAKATDEPLLHQLKKIALYVSFPSPYSTAGECENREEDCADQHPLIANDKQRRAEYIEFFKEKSKILPVYLKPRQLTQAFKQTIEERLSPYLMRGPSCEIPEIELLGSSEFLKSISDNDTLGILVQVDVQEETQPYIVVIRTGVYRKPSNNIDWRINALGASLLALPLNGETAKMQKLFQQFISNSIPSGTSPLTHD